MEALFPGRKDKNQLSKHFACHLPGAGSADPGIPGHAFVLQLDEY